MITLGWQECHSPRLCRQTCCLPCLGNSADWRVWGIWDVLLARNSSEVSLSRFLKNMCWLRYESACWALSIKHGGTGHVAHGLPKLTGDHVEVGRFPQNHPDKGGTCCCHSRVKECVPNLSGFITPEMRTSPWVRPFRFLDSVLQKCPGVCRITCVQDVHYSMIYTSEKVGGTKTPINEGMAQLQYTHTVECHVAVEKMRSVNLR